MKFLALICALLFSSFAHAQLVSTPQMALAAQGKSFIASTGPMNLTLAGNMRALFTNPVGSNVRVMITAVTTVNTSGGTVFANLYLNPATGLPSTNGCATNSILSGAPTRANFKADTSTTALAWLAKAVYVVAGRGRVLSTDLLS